MNRRLYKNAYRQILEKRYFFRHLILFVVGNFVLFFFSLASWTPTIFYLLTLVWIRVLALHFTHAYPEVVKSFHYRTEAEEEAAIKKEMKRMKQEQKVLDSGAPADGQLHLHPEASPATTTASVPYKSEDLV